MLPVQRELAALKFLDGLSAHLKDVREPHKALRHALRDTRDVLSGRPRLHRHAPCRAVRRPTFSSRCRSRRDWDLDVLTRYIRHTHPPVQRDMLIGSVRRRGGAWGAIALVRPGHSFDRDDRRLHHAHRRRSLSAAIHRIDRDRLLGVRDRIDRKIMEQIHPKDLFYQILDGIRSLTLYDHSSALLIREEDEASLRVVAEQIAWTKAKSERIGLRFRLRTTRRRCCSRNRCTASIAMATRWQGMDGISRPAGLPPCSTTTTMTPPTAKRVREASMLCAPLVTRDSLVGVLKIAARYPEQLKPFDAELVEHFRSQAAIAIQNLHRTESLRARVVTAERKHAMADLARERVTRREQRARVDAAADPADAGDLRSGDVHTGRVCRGPRARAEVASGLPPDFRRDADVLAERGAAKPLTDRCGAPSKRRRPS